MNEGNGKRAGPADTIAADSLGSAGLQAETAPVKPLGQAPAGAVFNQRCAHKTRDGGSIWKHTVISPEGARQWWEIGCRRQRRVRCDWFASQALPAVLWLQPTGCAHAQNRTHSRLACSDKASRTGGMIAGGRQERAAGPYGTGQRARKGSKSLAP